MLPFHSIKKMKIVISRLILSYSYAAILISEYFVKSFYIVEINANTIILSLAFTLDNLKRNRLNNER